MPDAEQPPSARDAHDAPECVLRPGARFEGLVALRGPGRLDGVLEGRVIASDLLWIGESAHVAATLSASEIVIAGAFEGQAAAQGRIELLDTAHVRATLDTPRFVLAEGAFFEGHCQTSSGEKPAADSPERRSERPPGDSRQASRSA